MEDNIIQELLPIHARKALKECLEVGVVIPSRHFRDELSNERLSIEDAYAVLRTGNIYDPPEPDPQTDEWKYRIEGHSPVGQWIVIVFCFKKVDRAILITIFSVSAKRRKS